MVDAPWKSLVESLKEGNFESKYLDRLDARFHIHNGQKPIEQEIIEEMASALRRSEDNINFELLKLEVLERDFQEAEEDKQAELAQAFNDQWDKAKRRIWEFRVHREAIGLFWSKELDAMYPLPRRKPINHE